MAGDQTNLTKIPWPFTVMPTIFKKEYEDVDYGFTSHEEFKPATLTRKNFEIDNIRSETDLDRFYDDCSDDDRDTLDLNFTEDTALGIYDRKELVGVARLAPTRALPQLLDITVLIRPQSRGLGLSTPLVSKLVENGLTNGNLVKYRVAAENRPSRAVAERLGLKALYELETYSI